MKPYSNPWKFTGKYPFVSCRKEFHSGGQGHFVSQVAAHLINVHGRREDARPITSGMMRNPKWLLPNNVSTPIWKTKWWDYSTGSPVIAYQLLDEGWGKVSNLRKYHYFDSEGHSLCGKWHVSNLIKKREVHADYKCKVCQQLIVTVNEG